MSFYTFGSKSLPGFIFIGPPKTASTSLRVAVETHYNTHDVEVRKRSHVPADYSEFDGLTLPYVACIRNPYDRMVSAFQHVYNVHSLFDDEERLPPPNQQGFNRFVKYVYAHDLTWKNINHYMVQTAKPGRIVTDWDKEVSFKRNQVNYLKRNNEVVDLELLIRHENIEEDYKKLQKYIGYKGPLPKITVGKMEINYREIYTRHTKSLVEEIFAEDLDYFKYTF